MSVVDLVVIGAGPGGYVAALRAAQLGMRVICVDERAVAGGTCLNVGCIPSKALLSSSGHWAELAHLADHGIHACDVKFDLGRMMDRKDRVVSELTNGVAFLFKKAGVEFVTGRATIRARGEVTINGNKISARNILIATGSVPACIPSVVIDEEVILSSTGALSLPNVPERLVVIGAGVVGLELGQVWSRLGSSVRVIEYADRILAGMDGEVSRTAQRLLGRKGISFALGTAVSGVRVEGSKARIAIEKKSNGEAEEIEADAVLMAIGRRPNTAGLGLESLGVELNEDGFVKVDAHFRTSVPGILAIGDVVRGPMLAHKAEEDAVACIEALAGNAYPAPDYRQVPSVVYTDPEIACVGITEDAAKIEGRPFLRGKAYFLGNGRALAMGTTDGFVKVIGCEESGRLLGAHVVGHGAGELIQELVLALRLGATLADIAATSHAHPGMAEAVKEACVTALLSHPTGVAAI